MLRLARLLSIIAGWSCSESRMSLVFARQLGFRWDYIQGGRITLALNSACSTRDQTRECTGMGQWREKAPWHTGEALPYAPPRG
jgi:hypothetical protein